MKQEIRLLFQTLKGPIRQNNYQIFQQIKIKEVVVTLLNFTSYSGALMELYAGFCQTCQLYPQLEQTDGAQWNWDNLHWLDFNAKNNVCL